MGRPIHLVLQSFMDKTPLALLRHSITFGSGPKSGQKHEAKNGKPAQSQENKSDFIGRPALGA
jgi:hypothetical protein